MPNVNVRGIPHSMPCDAWHVTRRATRHGTRLEMPRNTSTDKFHGDRPIARTASANRMTTLELRSMLKYMSVDTRTNMRADMSLACGLQHCQALAEAVIMSTGMPVPAR